MIGKTYLSPLLLEMPTSFSIPPASRKALAFSIFFVMTSCKVQQMAVTVSSDMVLLAELLLLLPPGSRWTRSRMAYLPFGKGGKMMEAVMYCKSKTKEQKSTEKKYHIIQWFLSVLFCRLACGCLFI